jgi:hypothetical protein
MQYRTLVLRRSPVESRPPSHYSLVWSGDSYQVWQRPEGAPSPLEHLSLGSVVAPSGKPPCASVRGLAALPGAARIAYVARANPKVLRLDQDGLPDGWESAGGGSVLPGAPGSVTIPVTVPRSGAYAVWVGGSFRGRMSAAVDGRAVGAADAQLNNTGQYTELGTRTLRPGRHRITLDYSERGWSPGAGGRPFTAGPLVLAPAHTPDAVRYTSPAKVTTLCGRELDWVEALPG